jgi:2-amino-4-hydroxy-6-hydroxymethyldihydropteridine diphosphokinase
MIAYIGVGSNVGDRTRILNQARASLSDLQDVRFKRAAPVYETEAVGGPAQGRYLNTVWEIETDVDVEDLLGVLREVESQYGRKRQVKNGPRTLDLDLLFYGDCVIDKANLTIPHPRLHHRWFVLKPLWDLRSDLVHPVFKKSICELLSDLNESAQKS